MFSRRSLLIPVRTKDSREVGDAFCSSWIGVCGPLSCIQMEEGGGWKKESWAELRSEGRIKLLLREVGARPWTSGRRNGLARGIYDRLMEDHRFSGTQILAEVLWGLNALI